MWIVIAILAYLYMTGKLQLSTPTVTSNANGTQASETAVFDNTPLGNARIDVAWNLNSATAPGAAGTNYLAPVVPISTANVPRRVLSFTSNLRR